MATPGILIKAEDLASAERIRDRLMPYLGDEPSIAQRTPLEGDVVLVLAAQTTPDECRVLTRRGCRVIVLEEGCPEPGERAFLKAGVALYVYTGSKDADLATAVRVLRLLAS